MTSAWRFLDTGCGDAAYNMAVDEALLLSHEAGQSPPTLRVYTWSSPTLSLGYAQSIEKEVDTTACREHGVTPIRRPTGGRAVLHDDEATYSIVMPLRLDGREASITEHYRRIGLALEAALRRAGLAVTLERPSVLAAAPRPPSPACFAALSRYELSATGRKLVGSAQKRGRRSLLQHGSIPLSMDRQRLFACLRVPAGRREQLLGEAYASMAAVNEVAPAPLDAAALQRALRQGFVEWLTGGAGMSAGGLSAAERGLVEKLRLTKYNSDAWNLDGPAAWRRGQAAGAGE
ncbi:MAG: biotin/lipoate A/B protein ligase family protein [Candidatus Tectomicrobia bacterium]|nr:biotin/lipoate A/B protein ligase family protein [Candidatus Tectomicrobia bacterium]